MGDFLVYGFDNERRSSTVSMDLVKTIIDWAILVVVWLVQLAVYPGFCRIEKSRFVTWHSRYLRLMGYLVGPLMIGQLAFAVWNVFMARHWISAETLYLGLVALTWIATFRMVVPIHDKLQSRGNESKFVRQLVWANWPRTVLWSVIVIV